MRTKAWGRRASNTGVGGLSSHRQSLTWGTELVTVCMSGCELSPQCLRGHTGNKPRARNQAGHTARHPREPASLPGVGGGGPAPRGHPRPTVGTPWTDDHPSTSRKTRKNHKSRGASDFQSWSARDLNYVFTQITYKNDQTNGRGGLCLSVAGAVQKCREVGGRWVRFPRLGEVCYKIFHSTPTQAPRLAPPQGLSKIDWSPTQPPTPDLFLRQLLSPLHASALSRSGASPQPESAVCATPRPC